MPVYTLWIKSGGRQNDYLKTVEARSREDAAEKILSQDKRLIEGGWDKETLVAHIQKEL